MGVNPFLPEFAGKVKNKLDNPDRLYPKMWKKIEDIALGDTNLDEYTEQMLKLESEMPVAPRHLIGFKTVENSAIDPATVDKVIQLSRQPIVLAQRRLPHHVHL